MQSAATPNVAILVDTATGWGRRLVHGILHYAREHGPWHLVVEPRGRHERLSLPPGWRGDGVIARVSTPAIADELRRTGLPVVNVSGIQVAGADYPRVAADYEAGARMVLEYFLDRGFRHFGYAGPMTESYVRDHQSAFERALGSIKAPCAVYRPLRAARKEAAWKRRLDHLIQWLRALPKPVAIYTWGTEVGRQVIDACLWDGIPVPHDVAVMGGDYDDLLSDASYPSLSGLLVASEQQGRLAAEMLDRILGDRRPLAHPVFVSPIQVVERLSTDTLAVEQPQVKQAMTYLRRHACEPIDVTDILRAVPMARRSLERLFRLHLGRTPAEEIRRIRIDHARELLVYTNQTMQDIAEACGFATYNYLSAIFKRETGLTPSAYRARMTAGQRMDV